MNENTKPVAIEPVPPPVPQSKNMGIMGKIAAKMPPKLRDVLIKFYSNKKIFWPVSIAFGILFLVILAGLMFGSPAPQVITNKVTPTPFAENVPTASPSGDVLSVTGARLKSLNDQIKALDLKQSRLQPPEINFDISF